MALPTCPRMSCIWSVSRLVRSLERPASQSRPRWGKEYLQMKVTCENSCSSIEADYTGTLSIGAFNVQNVMRSSWDWKIFAKYKFLFLLNVWNVLFLSICFESCTKSANMTKKLSSKSYMGYQKHRIVCWFQIHWNGIKTMSRKK
jgi:hypothetical protein